MYYNEKHVLDLIHLNYVLLFQLKISTDHGLFIGEHEQNERYSSNSIIAQPFGKRTLFRYWLSADSKEDRNDWCNILNQILADLREWGN